MGEETSISWTHATFNPWWGCSFVGGSRACAPAPGQPGAVCYANTWAERTGHHVWGDDAPRRFFGEKHWQEPLKWNRAAEKAGERHRVFCMSMGDIFEGRPDQQEAREKLWETVRLTPQLDWLLLTKRPQRINNLYTPGMTWAAPPTNVWLGITAEDQKWLDIRWPHLADNDASVYWLSMEPLFERVTLPEDFLKLGHRAWVIVGGQSGPGAVDMDLAWARYVRDQCKEAGVPFHFKQQSQKTFGPGFKVFANVPADLQIREYPHA